MTAQYRCRNSTRRHDLDQVNALAGIDYLEVDEPQLHLTVHFINTPGALTEANFRVLGGARITGIRVTKVVPAGPQALKLTVDRYGDFSTYTLRVVRGADDPRPPADFDPQLSEVEFSFKVHCESDFDCKPGCACHPKPAEEPEINYLARDYPTFRRLMLDRLSLLLPQWRERNVADVGVALVEALAYAADHVAYRQDSVATEAFLGTARKRTSVRRHARLVDYPIHDGCNARVWVQVRVGPPSRTSVVLLPKKTLLFTRVDGQPAVIEPSEAAKLIGGERFETMEQGRLFAAHNQLPFYTWSGTECCLPKGATRATLAGQFADLAKGDVLVFREVLGAESGNPADADPSHAHAVRLTSVSTDTDPVTTDPITEIAWDAADALPFPLCLSTRVESRDIPDVSVALGNIVLADHGQTISGEALPPLPRPNPALNVVSPDRGCGDVPRVQAKPRYRPALQRAPLTRAASLRGGGPASAAMTWTMREVMPEITLTQPPAIEWKPRLDLLGSDSLDRGFVVESEDDVATLRFGDDKHGRGPDAGTSFTARYRVGNGRRGNVGAGAIAHAVLPQAADAALAIADYAKTAAPITNPMPAQGGVDPEPLEDVRQKAPVAFRRNERAVVAADYEEVAQRHPQVQRAAATFRWTGSWYTVYLTVDRAGGRSAKDPKFRKEIRALLERYRMAGVDVEIDAPRFVPLELKLRICVAPDYFRADVQKGVLQALRTLFDPDRLTFGQTVYLSHVYAAAHSAAGVQSVTVLELRRRDLPSAGVPSEIRVGRLEIAQLENDPSFPEHGIVRLQMEGGR
jgi:Baseplate J-like protein